MRAACLYVRAVYGPVKHAGYIVAELNCSRLISSESHYKVIVLEMDGMINGCRLFKTRGSPLTWGQGIILRLLLCVLSLFCLLSDFIGFRVVFVRFDL